MDTRTEQHYLHAIKVAILKEQKEFEGVKLPSPQKTGTSVQRNSYAKMQAQEIFDKHFKVAKTKTMLVVPNDRFIETVCALAEKVVEERFGADTLEEEEGGGTRYTEQAQDFFNEVYDEFEDILINTLGVKSDTDE